MWRIVLKKQYVGLARRVSRVTLFQWYGYPTSRDNFSPYKHWLTQLGQLGQGETITACASAVLDNQSMCERCWFQQRGQSFFIIYMLAKVDNWLPCFTKIINSLMTTWSMIEQSFPSRYSSAKRAIKSETLKILKSKSLDRSSEMGNRWKSFETENRWRKSFESRPTAQCGHFLFSS